MMLSNYTLKACILALASFLLVSNGEDYHGYALEESINTGINQDTASMVTSKKMDFIKEKRDFGRELQTPYEEFCVAKASNSKYAQFCTACNPYYPSSKCLYECVCGNIFELGSAGFTCKAKNTNDKNQVQYCKSNCNNNIFRYECPISCNCFVGSSNNPPQEETKPPKKICIAKKSAADAGFCQNKCKPGNPSQKCKNKCKCGKPSNVINKNTVKCNPKNAADKSMCNNCTKKNKWKNKCNKKCKCVIKK